MKTAQRPTQQFLPELKSELKSEFQGSPSKKTSPLFKILFSYPAYTAGRVKNGVQNIVAFLVTAILIVPMWLIQTGFRGLDGLERMARLFVWVFVKLAILLLNLTYRVVKMLGLFRLASWIRNKAAKHFKRYLVNQELDDSFSRDSESSHGGSRDLEQNPEQDSLIDVSLAGERIKTPNLFAHHLNRFQASPQSKAQGEMSMNEFENRKHEIMIPEKEICGNMVRTVERIKTPKLHEETQSHTSSDQKTLKRNMTSPNMFLALEVETEEFQRQSSFGLSEDRGQDRNAITPDAFRKDKNSRSRRYTFSPSNTHSSGSSLEKQRSFIDKKSQKMELVGEEEQSEQSYHESVSEKEELQEQILTLRKKMSELVNENNREIEEMEEWICEKSKTITNTRKENLELLEQMQELQRDNVEKTRKFIELENKVKTLQSDLDTEKKKSTVLSIQIEQLEEDIRSKSIEIVNLREKIRSNYHHMQMMTNLLGENQESKSRQSSVEKLEMHSAKKSEKDLAGSLGKKLNEDLSEGEETSGGSGNIKNVKFISNAEYSSDHAGSESQSSVLESKEVLENQGPIDKESSVWRSKTDMTQNDDLLTSVGEQPEHGHQIESENLPKLRQTSKQVKAQKDVHSQDFEQIKGKSDLGSRREIPADRDSNSKAAKMSETKATQGSVHQKPKAMGLIPQYSSSSSEEMPDFSKLEEQS